MTEFLLLVVAYIALINHLVWYYFDDAHFKSVDDAIEAAHAKCKTNDWTDINTPWAAFDMWNATRGPFLGRRK